MSIRIVDHVNIVTDRLAETRDFYIQVLGLKEGWRPPFAVEGHWLYAGERPVVHIQQARRSVGPSEESSLNHAAFDVDNLDGMLAVLRAHGIAYQEAPVPETATRQAFFSDPNGVRLELNYTPSATRASGSADAA